MKQSPRFEMREYISRCPGCNQVILAVTLPEVTPTSLVHCQHCGARYRHGKSVETLEQKRPEDV